MQDLADRPFSPKMVSFESGADTKRNQAWYRWCAQAERLLGHDLDGHDPDFRDGEGYSLDEAHECWSKGTTAQAYVSMVAARERYRKPD